jgi:hypothetical protein
MKRNAVFIFLLLLICSTTTIFSQNKKFSIDVRVSGDSEIKTDVSSYLKRELRSLADIDVVEVGDFGLLVNVMKLTTKDGTFTGYAVNYSLVETISCGSGIYMDLQDSGLFVGGRDDLRKITEDIVTDIDTEIFEKKRKSKK